MKYLCTYTHVCADDPAIPLVSETRAYTYADRGASGQRLFPFLVSGDLKFACGSERCRLCAFSLVSLVSRAVWALRRV
jgi:hypothetical protein